MQRSRRSHESDTFHEGKDFMKFHESHDTGGGSSTLGGTLRLALEGTFQGEPKGTPQGAGNTPSFMKFHEIGGVFSTPGSALRFP